MIGTTRRVRVWARARPTDLRKGFCGLAGLVASEMGADLRQGDLFLFVNRRRTLAKVLLWDGSGLCIYAKRLAEGRFARLWSTTGPTRRLCLTAAELNLFLEGATVTRQAG